MPILKDQPAIRSLALLAVIGGGPAIVGAWVGGLVYSQPLSVLFLAIGAGAVFRVAYEIARQMIWKGMANCQIPVTVFAGVLTYSRWVHSPDNYFLSKAVLRKVFRGKFVAALRQAFRNGELRLRES